MALRSAYGMSVQGQAPLGSELSREAPHGSLMTKNLLSGGTWEMGRACGVMTTCGLPPRPHWETASSVWTQDVCFP